MAFVNFAPTRLTFTFNGDGTVQIEKSANGRVQKHEGTWGTRGQTMRLQAPGGGDSVPFSVSGNKVGFPYEDAKVSLTKQ